MTSKPQEWNDQLRVGDARIDSQHKAFYMMALRVFVACKLGKGADEVAETLKFMREYVYVHFSDEESRMRSVQYPHMETHLEAHRGLLTQLDELELGFVRAEDKHSVARKAADVATRWFNNHIVHADLPLVRYLKDRGVSSDEPTDHQAGRVDSESER